ncbi:YcfF/hinT protein: a purine nucleoside phosphoramidase [Cronobacter malonaticus 681]|nr:YcfF/hinT protein: a purine nucleoside phosphoramidase [Cronobacter malonaticus 681]
MRYKYPLYKEKPGQRLKGSDYLAHTLNVYPRRKKTMAEETIFSKIIRREIPADIVYQDELVTAFRDISPQAPTHILIVPNVLVPTVNDVTAEHEQALGRLFTVAAKIAQQEGIAEDGYRLIMNCNRHGGQEVYHIHMHLVGGRALGPMLAHKGL